MDSSLRVNFHCHSNCSDGNTSVAQVVKALHADNVKYFALTDHDTLAGVKEAQKIAESYDMQCINGIELTVTNRNDFMEYLHMLAINFDYNILSKELEKYYIKEEKIVIAFANKLRENGYKFNLEISHPSRQYLTHNDLSHALIVNGYAKNRFESFVEILNKEEYSEFKAIYPDPKSAIDMVHKANGLAIMAHPFDILVHAAWKDSITQEQSFTIIRNLKELGLDGIEVYYKNFSSEQIAQLNDLADELNLIKSIGTDYHGKSKDSTWHSVEDEEKLITNVLNLN